MKTSVPKWITNYEINLINGQYLIVIWWFFFTNKNVSKFIPVKYTDGHIHGYIDFWKHIVQGWIFVYLFIDSYKKYMFKALLNFLC
jgi:hypothetical protein